MWLSELRDSLQIEVLHDAEFESLGLLSANTPKRMVYVENERYAHQAIEDKAVACVVTRKNLMDLDFGQAGIVIAEHPRETFYDIHEYLSSNTSFYGNMYKSIIHPSACIHPTAFVAENNVTIGERCFIGPHVTIHENTKIMNDVIVRSGSVIGTEGFGFVRAGSNIRPLKHTGGVIIHDRVEIQANCCIAKALFGGDTEIGADTKTDNLVYIAHNVKIGKRCLVAAHASITGSVTIGDDVWIGPSATIAHELTIGDGAIVSIGAVVTKNVPPATRVSGNFAIDHEKFLSFIKSIR